MMRKPPAQFIVALILVGLFTATTGCGPSEISVTLQPREFQLLFGSASGTVMPVACARDYDPCDTVATQVSGVILDNLAAVSAGCDQATQHCAASLSMILGADLAIAEDPAYKSAILGKRIASVTGISIKYSVPTNSLTFAPTGIYVLITSADSSSMATVATLDPLAKMQTVDEGSASGTFDRGSAASRLLTSAIMTPPVPSQLGIYLEAQLRAGDALPAGRISVRVTPTLTIALDKTIIPLPVGG